MKQTRHSQFPYEFLDLLAVLAVLSKVLQNHETKDSIFPVHCLIHRIRQLPSAAWTLGKHAQNFLVCPQPVEGKIMKWKMGLCCSLPPHLPPTQNLDCLSYLTCPASQSPPSGSATESAALLPMFEESCRLIKRAEETTGRLLNILKMDFYESEVCFELC